MKIINKINTAFIALSMIVAFGTASCTDYLDKEPESVVNEEDAFKNFTSFQGFVEEMYNAIPDKMKTGWTSTWNYGDDEILNTEPTYHMIPQMDLGNFWWWQREFNSESYAENHWFDKANTDPGAVPGGANTNSRFKHAIWPNAWYCIRKANVGIANFDMFAEGTQEEKDFILGQLYFFRAWWHFQLMEWFGGMPYLDQPLTPETSKMDRLTFRECADKAAADLRMAADLLPVDWDLTDAGKRTYGKNANRITKITALGYLGKVYLWAGSPLNEHGAKTGAMASGETYTYNSEYCAKAADAFGELLALVDGESTRYKLVPFNYDHESKNIYNHKRKNAGVDSYTDIFYTTRENWMTPGRTESILRGLSGGKNKSNTNATKSFTTTSLLSGAPNVVHAPTANLVEEYGMANGLPLNAPGSGYDPEYPFKNRDPRFYHDIIFDGFKYVNASGAVPGASKPLVYTPLYTGSSLRAETSGSRSGYFIQKLVPHECNTWDKAHTWGWAIHLNGSYMRLADIYLMYAEACAANNKAGAKGTSTTFPSMNAEDAVNRIRNRAGAGVVNMAYANTYEIFMDEIRRERSVELSFEGFRFNDLQRWLLLTEAPYNIKYSHEFTRAAVADGGFDEKNPSMDPRNAKVVGLTKKVILTRNFNAQHYWFPLKKKDVSIYAGFNQNPGW